MLREHLSQQHDGASRRVDFIDRHVSWIHHTVLQQVASSVLDLGCGPGLYTHRLARLGHACLGVDIAPAAVEYARSNTKGNLNERYELGDFTGGLSDGHFDLVMIIHGEFNTLDRAAARRLLDRVAAVLTPDGRLLLEVHPYDAVIQIGRRAPAWIAESGGLFGDGPYVRLDESRWDEGAGQAVRLNWIIDGTTFTVERFGTVTRAYSDDAYRELLKEAGLSIVAEYPSLLGDNSDRNYFVLVASR